MDDLGLSPVLHAPRSSFPHPSDLSESQPTEGMPWRMWLQEALFNVHTGPRGQGMTRTHSCALKREFLPFIQGPGGRAWHEPFFNFRFITNNCFYALVIFKYTPASLTFERKREFLSFSLVLRGENVYHILPIFSKKGVNFFFLRYFNEPRIFWDKNKNIYFSIIHLMLWQGRLKTFP